MLAVTRCDFVLAPACHPGPELVTPHLRPSLIHGGRGWVVLQGLFYRSQLLPARG